MKPKQEEIPPPGSKEAVEMGCTCPVMDNNYGKGYMGQKGVYWYTEGCPIHTFDYEEPEEK